MVVKRHLEPMVEPQFHRDSYGYRPGKSALDAVGVARQRCWRYDWVLDLDIKAFFDSIDTELLMRAVRKHTDCPWVLLYIDRWLKAPVQMADGSLIGRERGTPQGGVISPLLANLFLHYAFDMWMRRNFPDIPFERYADDAICHCRTEGQAMALRAALDARFADCGLTLHPDKTKIVYCRDESRRDMHPIFKFDFLGYTFRPRLVSKRAGGMGVSFSPAASPKALKAIRGRSVAGRCTCAVTRPWMIWRGCSTRTYAAGSTTMAGSVPRLFIPPCGTSSDTWRDGSAENTSPCADTSGAPDTGLRGSRDVSLSCSPIGHCFMDTAEQWEPDDARVSRPVVCPAKAGMFSRDQTCRGKSQSPVVWIAEVMETETLKPIDKISLGEIYESPGRNKSERIVASKVKATKGRASNWKAKAA